MPSSVARQRFLLGIARYAHGKAGTLWSMLSIRRIVPVLMSIGLLVSIGFWHAVIARTPQRTADAADSPASYMLGTPITSAVGYSAHLYAQSDRGRYVGLIASGGATSMRDEIEWAYAEPTRGRFAWAAPDQLVTLAAQHHLHVLLTIDTTPLWASGASASNPQWKWLPPSSTTAYGVFTAAVAARYGAGGVFWRRHPKLPHYLPAGIELWNEENLSTFWGGRTPNPQLYAQMVIAAYPRIKHVEPSMIVVTGGLAPAGGYNQVICNRSGGHDGDAWNGVNYLQALYADGIHGHFDAIGWHPYNFWKGATTARMLAYNSCSAWSQMARTPVSARSLMVGHGDGAKRIWITETGAATCIAGATYKCVSQAQQADLATAEVRIWRTLGWAGGFYWYDIRDSNQGIQNDESYFGAVSANGSAKPVYHALQRAWG